MTHYAEQVPKLLRTIADSIESGALFLDEPSDGLYWTVFGSRMLDLDSDPAPTLGSFDEIDDTLDAALHGTRPLGDVDLIRIGDLLKIIASTR
jgi:hypothetical protein